MFNAFFAGIILAALRRIADYFLKSIGWAKIFGKCGVKKRWGFIPVFRNYQIAVCANEKDDGVIWLLMDFMSAMTQLLYNYLLIYNSADVTSMTKGMLLMLSFTFAMISLFYQIRILLKVCDIFGKRKRWIVGWIFLDSIVAFYWGLSKKFMPKHKVGEDHVYVAPLSGETKEILDQGLTINITDFTAREFLKKHILLQDIHLNIKPGRMVLLLGGSGAGKTTFLNAVTGYEKANASIHLDGLDVYRSFNQIKYQIGFVPQMDLIRYQDTVYNTLMDAATLRLPVEMTHKQRKERVNEVLDIFGLAPVKDKMVGKQSGGQKKRISIASEFISNPSLYILDEPDSGLDGILAKDLMRRLHEISREGKIVVVITHTPDRVLQYFDDVIVLAKDSNHTGRLVYYGEIEKAKEFFGRNTMEEVVKMVNRTEEGGEGKADELIEKFGGMNNGTR